MRLIDADALIKYLNDWEEEHGPLDEYIHVGELQDQIDSMAEYIIIDPMMDAAGYISKGRRAARDEIMMIIRRMAVVASQYGDVIDRTALIQTILDYTGV